jgi:hypothetical protein
MAIKESALSNFRDLSIAYPGAPEPHTGFMGAVRGPDEAKRRESC